MIAWASGSDSERANLHPRDTTGVNSIDDLLTELKKGNEYIFARLIWAPNIDIAKAAGYKEAMFDEMGYTAHDTISTCFELQEDGSWTIDIPALYCTSEGIKKK